MTVSPGTRPELRSYPVSRSPGRRQRLAGPNLVVIGYLAAALLAAVLTALGEPPPGLPSWLTLHLLVLGAATNAVVIWSAHFTDALLHARAEPRRTALSRLVALNGGILAVLAGVPLHVAALVLAGAVLVIAAVGSLAVRFTRLIRTSLAGRLRPVVGFYVAGAVTFAVGASLGTWLATAGRDGTAEYAQVVAAHAHLNVFGWLGLSALGTLFMLWPAALRTRMVESAPRIARRVLALTSGGLAVAVVGLLAGVRPVAALGMAGYAGGVLYSLRPALRTARQRPPHTAAGWLLGAATGWLAVSVLIDVVTLLLGHGPLDRAVDRLVPLLAAGFVGQLLTGALSFLLPVILGGGPTGNRALTARLEYGWRTRLAATNLGVLALALPTGGVLRAAGWAATLAGLGSFVPLAAAAFVSTRTTSRLASGHARDDAPDVRRTGDPHLGRGA